MKTNRIPNTVLNLGIEVGMSFPLLGARSIESITTSSYGPYKDATGKRNRNKEHYIDIEVRRPDGDTFLHRSPVIRNAKKLRTLHRQVTRRLAEFLAVNK